MPAVLENLESTGVYKHRFGINALNGIVKVVNEGQNIRQLISDWPNALHDVENVFHQGQTATSIDIAIIDTKNIDAKHNVYFQFNSGPWTFDTTLAINVLAYTLEGLAAGIYEIGATAVSDTRESSNIKSMGFVILLP